MVVRVYTVLWVFWLLQFVVIEWAAYTHGGYKATATGHLVSFMLSNQWAFVAVPLVFVGIALHLVVDGLKLSR